MKSSEVPFRRSGSDDELLSPENSSMPPCTEGWQSSYITTVRDKQASTP